MQGSNNWQPNKSAYKNQFSDKNVNPLKLNQMVSKKDSGKLISNDFKMQFIKKAQNRLKDKSTGSNEKGS